MSMSVCDEPCCQQKTCTIAFLSLSSLLTQEVSMPAGPNLSLLA